MGNKKLVGMLGVALAGASLGIGTDTAYGLASYDASAGASLVILDIIALDPAGGPAPLDDLVIIGGAKVSSEGGGAIENGVFGTTSFADPPGPVPMGIGDGIIQEAGADGSAFAPADSLGFSGTETDGSIFFSNESTVFTYEILLGIDYSWDIDVSVDDVVGEDADGSIFIGVEGLFETFVSETHSFISPTDGVIVSEGDGGGFVFPILLEPIGGIGPSSDTISLFVDASGSARARAEKKDSAIPEPVTAILGGLGMVALAAGSSRRRK